MTVAGADLLQGLLAGLEHVALDNLLRLGDNIFDSVWRKTAILDKPLHGNSSDLSFDRIKSG